MWEDPEVDGKMSFKSSEHRSGLVALILEFERKKNKENPKSVVLPVSSRTLVSSYRTITTLYILSRQIFFTRVSLNIHCIEKWFTDI
jgi:hypothetical protein